MPVYGRAASFGFASCVCISSLTRSSGATEVLAMAPANPPSRKSFMNFVIEKPAFEPEPDDEEPCAIYKRVYEHLSSRAYISVDNVRDTDSTVDY